MTWQKRKKVQLKKLQSVIGLLNFACIAICPGNAFLRRFIDLTCVIYSHHFLNVWIMEGGLIYVLGLPQLNPLMGNFCFFPHTGHPKMFCL